MIHDRVVSLELHLSFAVTKTVPGDAHANASAPRGLHVDAGIADEDARQRRYASTLDNLQQAGGIGLAAGGGISTDDVGEPPREVEALENLLGRRLWLVG